MKFRFSKIAIGIIVLLALGFAWAWKITKEAEYYQSQVGPEIRREFGFHHGSPYLKVGSERREVFTLHPTPGGPFDQAGIRNGDIVVDLSITGLYKLIHGSRGDRIAFRVVDGGDGPPLDERDARSIEIFVPAKVDGSGKESQGPSYFASPEEAVTLIREMLEKKQWEVLSRYYDLEGTDVDLSNLESGEFFYRTKRPEVAHPAGFWRYKHPFPPSFKFHHDQPAQEGNVVTVVLSIEIDQGGGMMQRGFSCFKMRKSAKGYQILPARSGCP